MKICQIYIKGYQQFENTFLDFTNPETGEPVNKVCLIGKNGTGKTTILKILNYLLSQFLGDLGTTNLHSNFPFIVYKLKVDQEFYFLLSTSVSKLTSNNLNPKVNTFKIYNSNIEQSPYWQKLISQSFHNIDIEYNLQHFSFHGYEITEDRNSKLVDKIRFKNNSNDLLIYSPSESSSNSYINVKDVPETSVNEALNYFNSIPFYHEVSDAHVKDFWKMIVYLIKKRESEQQEFENRPENLNKTKQQLIEEFEKINPKILNKVASLWNKILDKAGLEFDIENASNPIHLNENLKAYIVLKGTKQRIQYNELSTGIRNFIFRVGHIFSLYFNRTIDKGFLLLDEPENSLFPDFLFDLIENYENIVVDKNGKNNTQIFMATHNPIVAAQFEPHERVILEWESDGTVKAFKGKTPVGDDPNDILKNDFGLESLMGKKGVKMWEEYLDLKKQLRKDLKKSDKFALAEKISKIGSDYNFE